MGLFSKLFGKKKADTEPVNKKALGLKADAEIIQQPDPAPKKAAPAKAAPAPDEAKTAKAAPAEQAKVKETKPAAPKAQEQKAPTPIEQPKQAPAEEAEEAAAEQIAESTDTVTVEKSGGGRFEIKKSKDGRFVFNLYAKNHMIIATSRVYSSSSAAANGIKSVIATAPIAAVEDHTLKSYEPQNFPKWEIYLDKGEQFRFRLHAANGICICRSQGYTNKTNCKNGIQSIIRSSKEASVDKIYLKKDGE